MVQITKYLSIINQDRKQSEIRGVGWYLNLFKVSPEFMTTEQLTIYIITSRFVDVLLHGDEEEALIIGRAIDLVHAIKMNGYDIEDFSDKFVYGMFRQKKGMVVEIKDDQENENKDDEKEPSIKQRMLQLSEAIFESLPQVSFVFAFNQRLHHWFHDSESIQKTMYLRRKQIQNPYIRTYIGSVTVSIHYPGSE